MPEPYAFDVFLSYAAQDAGQARSVWQALSQGGLRVFWATEALKTTVGKSWMTAIQDSLITSQHFVLLWTPNSKGSAWVQEEYETFFGQCYVKDKTGRRLVILPAGEPRDSLPALLHNLQAASTVPELVAVLGGTDIETLRRANRELTTRADELTADNARLRSELEKLQRVSSNEQARLAAALTEAQAQIETLRIELARSKPAPMGHAEASSESGVDPANTDAGAIAAVKDGLKRIQIDAGSMCAASVCSRRFRGFRPTAA
jgi:hypothetical protein